MMYLMTAVIVTLAFYACSVNDNPAVKPSGRAVITVNIAGLYEEADMVDVVKHNLGNPMCISDTVLIYDQNGRLVKKLGTVTKSLEPLTIVAEGLPNGTYTLVAWQTGYSDEETSINKRFVLADEEELATVKLLQTAPILEFAYANGLASATVTVNGNSFEATVTPKLVGSIVNLKSEQAPQEYGYDEIDLYRMDQVTKGIYLDPARSEDDRWIVGDLEDDVYPFAYLEEGETHFPHYTLEHGDDMLLSVITWSLVDDYYESNEIVSLGHHKLQDGSNVVYYIDPSRISYQPPFFGQEAQLPAWKADRDAGILVNDPYLKWGTNLAEVEAHKKAKQFWADGNYQLEFWEKYGWHMWYYVAPSFTEQYLFETEDGQNLNDVMCICHDASLPIDIFTKSLLLQGYTYLGKLPNPDTEDYNDLFLSADEKSEALVYPNDYGGWVIEYHALVPEDLNHIIPANLAPASNMSRSIVSGMRRSSTHSATMYNSNMKPIKQRRSLKALDRK